MWSSTFWLAALERGIKTTAQTAAAVIVAAGVGLLDADWLTIASVAGMAGLVSILTSIGSSALTGGSPSLNSAETLTQS